MAATITITIEDGGKIQSEVSGVIGKDCDGIDKFLHTIGDVTSNTKKPEYFQKAGTAKAKQEQIEQK
jgi:hypothetical protein